MRHGFLPPSLPHESFMAKKHLEIIAISEVFKCLGGVLNRQFGYVCSSEDELIQGIVKFG
jgi:hypothetical protein